MSKSYNGNNYNLILNKSLDTLIEKENNELKALILEQKKKRYKILHDFIKASHIGLNEATEASNKYKAIE